MILVKIFVLIIISYFILKFSSKVAFKFNLLDYPVGRKLHEKPTPYTGGISLAIIYIFFIFLLGDLESDLINILIGCLILSIVGFIDDKFDINPIIKIIFQTIPILFLINNNIYLTDLGNYEIIGLLNLGVYGKLFTLLCCLLIINAFNYCDGIDGLLSTLSINSLFFFILVFSFYNEIKLINFLVYLMIPILIFLIFNFSFLKTNKIFLGDSGSNLMGLLIGTLMIYFYNAYKIDPSILIWSVAYIIYEFLSTNILRILNKKNPFKSGNDHFHYQISYKYNLGSAGTNLIINLINIVLVIIGISINISFGSLYSLITFILLFFVFFIVKIKLFKN